jgi:molybdopterin synthase sulfur carrier subunit
MTVRIKYFGLLAEVTNCNVDKYPRLRDLDFQIAQNNEIVSKEAVVTGNEIALLPPFSGG